MALTIRRRDLDAIRAHLDRAYPEEGCGALIGRDGPAGRVVERVAELENRHAGARRRRYLVAPEQFLEVEKQARAEGLEVVGFYHSHPDHHAEPSRHDRDEAWPFYSYLIASVSAGAPGEMRCWRLAADGRRFVDEGLEIVSGEPSEEGAQESESAGRAPAIAGGSGRGAEDGPDGATGADGLPPLSRGELLRYGRHLILPEVGLEGQRRLKASAVLLVGAGGLGSPLALYLAAAGVGRIGLVDFDLVDESNLQRQVLHGTAGVGRPKLESARERLADLNPHVRIETHETRLSTGNALDLMAPYDVVVDGTDNFPTRYLVNDACALLGKPNVYGSIFRFEGQASVFDAARGPCYRCLYPEPPPPGLVPSCAEGGVLGVLPGVIGTLQAAEALKLLLGVGEPLIGRLLLFDALTMTFRELALRKDPACPLCGERRTVTELVDYERLCGLPPSERASAAAEGWEITPRELEALAKEGRDFLLIDVREPHEHRIARIPGAELIPLGTLPARMSGLDSSRTIVLHCHHGQRSQSALELLRRSGFGKLKNLRGGIDAWSRDVDPSVPRY